MSRRLRYQVAVSLDGFIAGPNGEHDWIVMDPAIDFAALFKEFDTAVMGRKTYDVLTAQGGHGAMPGLEVVVFSRTLPATTHRGVRIFNDDPREIVAKLKAEPGRDIWLYGGGTLFRSLLDAGLVDTVEVAVVPVLLGAGVPLLPPGAATRLVLADQKTLPVSRDRGALVFGAWRRWPRSPHWIHQGHQDSGEEADADPPIARACSGQEAVQKERGATEDSDAYRPAQREVSPRLILSRSDLVARGLANRPLQSSGAPTLGDSLCRGAPLELSGMTLGRSWTHQ